MLTPSKVEINVCTISWEKLYKCGMMLSVVVTTARNIRGAGADWAASCVPCIVAACKDGEVLIWLAGRVEDRPTDREGKDNTAARRAGNTVSSRCHLDCVYLYRLATYGWFPITCSPCSPLAACQQTNAPECRLVTLQSMLSSSLSVTHFIFILYTHSPDLF